MNVTTVLIWGMLAAATSAPMVVPEQKTNSDRLQDSTSLRAPKTTAHRPDGQASYDDGLTTYPIPQITVVAPPQVQAPWSLRDRITWSAHLILVLSAYIGIWIALSTLKKIESQTRDVERAAIAAATTAEAALQHTRAIIRSERPWVTVTAQPFPDQDNTSIVVATNRGRSPARIIAMTDRTMTAIDESHLPPRPEYGPNEKTIASAPMLLLPGESTAIKTFGLQDLEQSCDEETLKSVEAWRKKVFIYGRLMYKDLNAPEGEQEHETSWCCWYIYGQKKSGLVTMGLPEYTTFT